MVEWEVCLTSRILHLDPVRFSPRSTTKVFMPLEEDDAIHGKEDVAVHEFVTSVRGFMLHALLKEIWLRSFFPWKRLLSSLRLQNRKIDLGK